MKLYLVLEQQLKKEPDFVSETGELKKWVVLDKAQHFDETLITLRLQNKNLKKEFFFLNREFEDVYLLQNERELKIFDKQGRAFEPDFLLFCRKRNEEQKVLQVFIEPKGTHLKDYDKWKNDFLKEIQAGKKNFTVSSSSYIIKGILFIRMKMSLGMN
ncbi:MAG: hypothetical protein ACK4R6_00850 [Spirosomataceae bacterium]